MAPTAEEELKLRLFNGELSQLGPAERFLKALVDIPFSFKRLEALLFMCTLQEEVSATKESFQILEVRPWILICIPSGICCYATSSSLSNVLLVDKLVMSKFERGSHVLLSQWIIVELSRTNLILNCLFFAYYFKCVKTTHVCC